MVYKSTLLNDWSTTLEDIADSEQELLDDTAAAEEASNTDFPLDETILDDANRVNMERWEYKTYLALRHGMRKTVLEAPWLNPDCRFKNTPGEIASDAGTDGEIAVRNALVHHAAIELAEKYAMSVGEVKHGDDQNKLGDIEAAIYQNLVDSDGSGVVSRRLLGRIQWEAKTYKNFSSFHMLADGSLFDLLRDQGKKGLTTLYILIQHKPNLWDWIDEHQGRSHDGKVYTIGRLKDVYAPKGVRFVTAPLYMLLQENASKTRLAPFYKNELSGHGMASGSQLCFANCDEALVAIIRSFEIPSVRSHLISMKGEDVYYTVMRELKSQLPSHMLLDNYQIRHMFLNRELNRIPMEDRNAFESSPNAQRFVGRLGFFEDLDVITPSNLYEAIYHDSDKKGYSDDKKTIAQILRTMHIGSTAQRQQWARFIENSRNSPSYRDVVYELDDYSAFSDTYYDTFKKPITDIQLHILNRGITHKINNLNDVYDLVSEADNALIENNTTTRKIRWEALQSIHATHPEILPEVLGRYIHDSVTDFMNRMEFQMAKQRLGISEPALSIIQSVHKAIWRKQTDNKNKPDSQYSRPSVTAVKNYAHDFDTLLPEHISPESAQQAVVLLCLDHSEDHDSQYTTFITKLRLWLSTPEFQFSVKNFNDDWFIPTRKQLGLLDMQHLDETISLIKRLDAVKSGLSKTARNNVAALKQLEDLIPDGSRGDMTLIDVIRLAITGETDTMLHMLNAYLTRTDVSDSSKTRIIRLMDIVLTDDEDWSEHYAGLSLKKMENALFERFYTVDITV
jgi:hypothetical protein